MKEKIVALRDALKKAGQVTGLTEAWE